MLPHYRSASHLQSSYTQLKIKNTNTHIHTQKKNTHTTKHHRSSMYLAPGKDTSLVKTVM